MSSSRQEGSQVLTKPKRRYDIPNHTTFFLPSSGLHYSPVATGLTAACCGSQHRCPHDHLRPYVAQLSVCASPPTSASGQAGASPVPPVELKPAFAVVLSTEAFWTMMTKKEVWDLLYVLHALEPEARTHRSVDKTVADIVVHHAHGLTIAESTRRRLEKFYSERAEVHYNEVPPMAEWSMAAVLSEVAEAKAQLENADLASKMSVVVISLEPP